jgi:hypothetical protein
MKHLLLLALTVFLFVRTSDAQTNTKNTIYFGYSFIEADRFTGGNLSAKGFEIGYSRYINDRFYGDITYGKFNFEGKGNSFFLEPEEMDYFNMSTFTLGLGYDFHQSERVILSGELAYLRQTTHELLGELTSQGVTFRETGNLVTHAPRLQLKARVFLTDNLQFVPAVAYGIRFRSQYTSYWLRAGLAYSF